jgi:hypothetical protein
MSEENEITGSQFLANVRQKAALSYRSGGKPQKAEDTEIAQFIKHEQMQELVDELNLVRNQINLEKTKALAEIDAKYKATIDALEFQYASVLSIYS